MSFIYLSHLADARLKDWLESLGHRLVIINAQPTAYPAICSHSDIFICRLGSASSPVFCKAPKDTEYPQCAALCASCNQKYFIHNLKITDPELLNLAKELKLEAIHVNQGFTRCNLLPVGDGFITSDRGIFKALKERNIDTLLIEEGHISLPGHSFGFIGGCAGVVGKYAVFNGNLSAHPDFTKISQYISSKGLELKYFPQYPLTDIGSIIESDHLLDDIRF